MNNQLVVLNDSNEPMTTSLKVAERFGKRHGNVIQKIESLECSIAYTELNFQLSHYKDGSGKKCKMYNLTRDGFSFLINKSSGLKEAEFTEGFIGAFNAMEKALIEPEPQWEIPKTFAEAMMLGAKQAKQLELQAPKVEAYHDLIKSEGAVNLQTAGKILGLRPNRFIKWLRNEMYIYNRSGRNIPYQGTIDLGLFRVGAVTYTDYLKDTPILSYQVHMTPKGLEHFRRMKGEGELPSYLLADLQKGDRQQVA
ncbi:MAG: hypothetical protein GY861_28570 [bacterium]|nr:hypothetical protein [bacterium]